MHNLSQVPCLVMQGAKLEQGHIPLYVRGDDANARQFPSLHAVQRHMADTGRFKMAWRTMRMSTKTSTILMLCQ